MFRQPVQLLRISGVLAIGITAMQYLMLRLDGSISVKTPLTLLEHLLAPRVSPELYVIAEQFCIWFAARLMWLGTKSSTAPKADRRGIRLLGWQVALTTLAAGDLMPLLAAQVGLLLPGRTGRLWIAGQIAIQYAQCVFLPGTLSWMQPALLSGADQKWLVALQLICIPVFHLLAYSLGLLGAVEAQQRNELAETHAKVLEVNGELRRVNAELLATQRMEAEAARVAERVMIARELHDQLGHHLAALSVNLQLATKLQGAEARKAVADAYLLARMLLSDVRHVVTDLRELDAASLREALETMAASISTPRIQVQFHGNLQEMGPLPGHTLFRCAQEAITNAVRHAQAKNMILQISRDESGYRLSARDDGRGATDLFYGNGLSGMRERVRELGGAMRCETAPGAGFWLDVQVPEKGAAA